VRDWGRWRGLRAAHGGLSLESDRPRHCTQAYDLKPIIKNEIDCLEPKATGPMSPKPSALPIRAGEKRSRPARVKTLTALPFYTIEVVRPAVRRLRSESDRTRRRGAPSQLSVSRPRERLCPGPAAPQAPLAPPAPRSTPYLVVSRSAVSGGGRSSVSSSVRSRLSRSVC